MNNISFNILRSDRLFAGILSIIWIISSVYPVQLSPVGYFSAIGTLFLLGLFYRFRHTFYVFVQRLTDRISPWAIILIGAAIRVAMVIAHDNLHNADGGDFERIALEMINGQYIMTPGRPPAPSWQTAAMYTVGGMHRSLPLLPQLLWDILHLWLVYRLGKYFFGINIGKIAALLLAFHPDHILNATEINTENGYFLLFYLGILLLLFGEGSTRTSPLKRGLYAISAGLCWGLAHYFRTTTPLALFAWGGLMVADRSGTFRRSWPGLFAGFFLAISPLIVYNKQTYGIWSAASYQMGGWSVFLSTNPYYLGNWNQADVEVFEQRAAALALPDDVRSAVSRDKLALQMAHERWRQNPWTWVFSAIAFKPYCLWGDNGGGIWTQRRFADRPILKYAFQAYFILYHKLLCLLAALGLWGLSQRTDPLPPYLRLFLWLALITTAAHSFLEVRAMYHHLFFGFMVWMAAFAICSSVHNQHTPPKKA